MDRWWIVFAVLGVIATGSIIAFDSLHLDASATNRVGFARATGNDAQCDQMTVNREVTVGQQIDIVVTMRNAGSTLWPAHERYNLGAVGDDPTWGLSRVSVPVVTGPGSLATFVFRARAPTTPGGYPFRWQMVQDGVEWFGQTCSRDITVTAPAANTQSCGTPGMNDLWEGNAVFQYQHNFAFASVPVMPDTHGTLMERMAPWQTDMRAMNMPSNLVVKNGVWYLFTRQYETRQLNYSCSNYAYLVVRNSTDQGKTWSSRVTVVAPEPSKSNECFSGDGSFFYDDQTATWQAVFQCLARDNIWRTCHASRSGASPEGPFDWDPANPVLDDGTLWNRISPNSGINNEGTFSIVEKRGEYYYVTFHGYKAPQGYRGVAKTKDFQTWEVVNDGPIFGPSDCATWNEQWSGGCVGSGQASYLKEDGTYYAMIEAADHDLFCTQGQHWDYGLIQSPSLESKTWLSSSQDPLAVSTEDVSTAGPTVGQAGSCGLQYSVLFRDDAVYLMLGRMRNSIEVNKDPATGIYLYKLVRGAPFASYHFREGVGHEYTESDTLSGNLQAKLSNVAWVAVPGNGGVTDTFVSFNGVNSVMTMPANPGFDLIDHASISINVSFQSAAPSGKSAFVAGKPGSYWLEQYRDGSVCYYVRTAAGSERACAQVPVNQYPQYTELKGSYDGNTIRISLNGVLAQENPVRGKQLVTSTSPFQVGNSAATADGYYGSFDGYVTSIDIGNAATDACVSSP
jgi:hypothetical protein